MPLRAREDEVESGRPGGEAEPQHPLEDERAAKRRRVDEILAEFDAGPDLAPGFTDEDMYDENGDPIY